MILLDGESLSCRQLHDIAHGAPVQVHPTSAWQMKQNSMTAPEENSILQDKRSLLIGPNSNPSSSDDLARAFILGHCAGVGDPLPAPLVRAAMAARVNVLATGCTGARPAAAGALLAMLNQGVHPRVPSQGSVGAAGDLAPMAHIAAVACGYVKRPDGLPDFSPTPKEALALINGVSLTTGMAAMTVVRARRVMENALLATAMTMEALMAHRGCLDERALNARGHAGPRLVGRRLRELLDGSELLREDGQPDAFSIRCAPQVTGAVWRTLSFVEIETRTELNGTSDNPLLMDGEWIESGNFHGSSIAMAMDHLKIALTQLATLSERRTFRLTHGQLSHDLPSFLVPGTGLNSGFMIAQYTAASLASECKGLAHPASVDSIPTVQHHEDHVSMGPIAARMALQLVECVADIVAIELLLAAQALELRTKDSPRSMTSGLAKAHAMIREHVPFWTDDTVLHPDIAAMGALVRSGALISDAGKW